jgi:hypothetical protein
MAALGARLYACWFPNKRASQAQAIPSVSEKQKTYDIHQHGGQSNAEAAIQIPYKQKIHKNT